MAIDFGNISGESFGDINSIFFKNKDGKDIVPLNTNQHDESMTTFDEIAKNVSDTVENARKQNTTSVGTTVIHISKEVMDTEDDVIIQLTELEEMRRNQSSVRNKHYIDVNTGEEVVIVEFTKMYNGVNLFTIKRENGELITYPRSMFVGAEKQFVPKEFYIREAERSLEDTISEHREFIKESIYDASKLSETPDGSYLEFLLDEPLEISNGIPVPDKVQIPVKRLFDLEYKLMMLEYVICLDNKVASLIFTDIWF